MNVHPRWYDRLPFPRMRDSLIKLVGVVDEEELLRDLFTMPVSVDLFCYRWGGWEGRGVVSRMSGVCTDLLQSWTIETEGRRGWESASWDPRAWRMEAEWEVKWGWLMV
jgi:hypothetical protein